MITPSYPSTAQQTVSPKVAIDFTTANLDSRITFTRTTDATNPATYINNSGIVTAATNNQPRFDYDPVTFACKGLLIEESRTNICPYSEAFASWSASGTTTISSDFDTAPNGTLTADKVTGSTSTTARRFVTIAMTTGVTYVFSLFVKQVDLVAPSLRILNPSSTVVARIDFNFTGGITITALTGTSNFILTTLPNGWYRISGTYTAAVTGNHTLNYYADRDGQSRSSLVWGGDVEVGSSVTSYIPNLSNSTTTRNADVAVMSGTSFSDWYNAAKGTFRVDAITPAVGTRPIISVDDDSANNSLLIKTEGTAPTFVATQSSSEQASVTAGAITANTDMYSYVSYDTNYFGIARVASRQVDTSGTVPTVDRLRIGASQTGAYLNGIVKKLQFWQ